MNRGLPTTINAKADHNRFGVRMPGSKSPRGAENQESA